MSELVIQPVYPIKTGVAGQIGGVIVLGCGGTGSYLIPLLARSISTLGRKVKLILIDGDTVEEKNLKRQNFVAPDIGQNKAEVMATRYGAFGIEISSSKKYLDKADDLVSLIQGMGTLPLIISCVDNVKTRMLVRDALTNYGGASYWIDTGNEEFNGQVVLGVRTFGYQTNKINAVGGLFPTPDVFDLYPEMIERAKVDKLPTELSCAELAAASPQYGFVNATSANLAMNYAHDLLTGRAITTHAVEFSVANTFTARPLTETAIMEWMRAGFAPIQAAIWLKKEYEDRLAKMPKPEPVKSGKEQAEILAKQLIDLLGKKPEAKATDTEIVDLLTKTSPAPDFKELIELMQPTSYQVKPVRIGSKIMV